MKRGCFFVAAAVVFVTGILSCKKKSDNSVSNLRIAGIDRTLAGSVIHYRFVYDRDNNVDSIIWVGDGASSGTSGFSTFNYFGSSYSITDQYGNAFTVYANTSGMILKVLQPDTLIVYYKNSIVDAVEHKTTTTSYSQLFTWSNGDVTRTRQPGDTLSYYYDNGVSGQAGDPWRVDAFISYGRSYIKTAHLPLGVIKKGDTLVKYQYLYDTRGRISRLTRIGNTGGMVDTTTYNYRYY